MTPLLSSASLLGCGSTERTIDEAFAAAARRSAQLPTEPPPAARGHPFPGEPTPAIRLIVRRASVSVDPIPLALDAWEGRRALLLASARRDGLDAVLPMGPHTLSASDASAPDALSDVLRTLGGGDRYALAFPARVQLCAGADVPFAQVEAAACAVGAAGMSELELLLDCGGHPCVLPAWVRGPLGPAGSDALDLALTVSSAGVRVAGAGGTLAAGCGAIGQADAISVPRRPGVDMLAALEVCLRGIKVQFPDEHSVRVLADPGVGWGSIIDVLQVAHHVGGEPLFDELLLCARRPGVPLSATSAPSDG